jgi:hypothetical protein
VPPSCGFSPGRDGSFPVVSRALTAPMRPQICRSRRLLRFDSEPRLERWTHASSCRRVPPRGVTGGSQTRRRACPPRGTRTARADQRRWLREFLCPHCDPTSRVPEAAAVRSRPSTVRLRSGSRSAQVGFPAYDSSECRYLSLSSRASQLRVIALRASCTISSRVKFTASCTAIKFSFM